MHLIKQTTHINFLKIRWIMVAFSTALVVASLVLIFTRGFNLALDFTGGTLIELSYSQAVELGSVRDALDAAGYGDAQVQSFGTAHEIVVRVPPQGEEASAQTSTHILDALRGASDADIEIRRQAFVGPQVGEELRERGALAMLYAILGIVIYVWLRFEWRFSIGSIAATLHDAIVTLGVFSLLQLDFDLTIIAAVLTVIGYSLNDTIVIFDRVRENFRLLRKEGPHEVMNLSINQTLSRTIITALTVLIVTLVLFFWGGEVLHGFALALIIGVSIGSYSTIYVATAVALSLGISREDLLPVKKEGAELDATP